MYEATVCILQAVAFFLAKKEAYTDGKLLSNIRCQTEISAASVLNVHFLKSIVL